MKPLFLGGVTLAGGYLDWKSTPGKVMILICLSKVIMVDTDSFMSGMEITNQKEKKFGRDKGLANSCFSNHQIGVAKLWVFFPLRKKMMWKTSKVRFGNNCTRNLSDSISVCLFIFVDFWRSFQVCRDWISPVFVAAYDEPNANPNLQVVSVESGCRLTGHKYINSGVDQEWQAVKSKRAMKKKGPWLFRVYRGWSSLPNYIGIIS